MEGDLEEKIAEPKPSEAKVSLFLSIILVLLLIAFIVLSGLILYRYYAQVQPKSPLQYEMERWQATVRSRPRDATAHLNLAWIYQQMNKLKDAEKEYNIALEIDSGLIEAHYQLGIIYLREKKYMQAVDKFEQIVERNPDHALSWYQLGLIRAQQKNYKEAIICFNNVLRIEPTWANVHRELGKAYEKLGEDEKAIEEYKTTLQFLPTDKEAKEGLKRLEAK